MQLAGDIVRYISIIAALIFVINFARLPWWRSLEGIFLMGFAGISVGYFSLVSVVRIFGRFEGYDVVSLVFFSIVASLLILLNVIAFISTRNKKREAKLYDDRDEVAR